jgi:Flp pilus assembly protein TadG
MCLRRLISPGGEERGQSLVEFAITFSILMGFVFAFIEVCLAFYTLCMISESAREGSRYAAMHGSACQTAASASCTASAAAINTYVAQLGYPNLGSGTMTVNTTFPDGSQAAGNHVTVAITYLFPITLAFVPRKAWTMTTSSTMTILQ